MSVPTVQPTQSQSPNPHTQDINQLQQLQNIELKQLTGEDQPTVAVSGDEDAPSESSDLDEESYTLESDAEYELQEATCT